MCKIRKKINQAASKGIYVGKDIKFTQKELKNFLMTDLGINEIKKDEDGWLIFNDKKIMIKNITYLGFKAGEDRSYKKRMQFSSEKVRSFEKNKSDKVILGHYQNVDGERMYVSFSLPANNIGKSKSSHVNVNDIQNAFNYGEFTKIDARRNVVQVFPPSELRNKISSNEKQPLVDFANYIFENKNEWIFRECFKEMKDAKFTHYKQTEWAGWYLEYLASIFFKNDTRVETKGIKKIGKWKPDAFLNEPEVPIELKFHNEEYEKIPGNDYDGMMEAIKKYEKVYLFVADGEVEREIEGEWEESKWRKNEIGEPIKKQYKKRLKKRVKINNIGFCVIDQDMFDKLGLFKQGKNSNGKKRNPKLMFDSKMLDFLF